MKSVNIKYTLSDVESIHHSKRGKLVKIIFIQKCSVSRWLMVKMLLLFFSSTKDRCYCSDYNTDFLKCESLCIINFPFPDSSLSMEPIKGILQIIHFNSLQQTKMKSATYFTSSNCDSPYHIHRESPSITAKKERL